MTPTEFMIDSMTTIDEVSLVVCVRRMKDGSICYNSNTNNNYDIYAAVCMVKAFVESETIKREIEH